MAVGSITAAGDSPDVEHRPQVELGMTWLRQKKDNPLLCIDGDAEGNPRRQGRGRMGRGPPDGIYTHGGTAACAHPSP